MVPLAFWPVRGAFGERNGCHVNVHRKVHGRSSEKLFVTRLPIYSAYKISTGDFGRKRGRR